MSMNVTLAALAAALTVLLWAIRVDRRPIHPARPRLLPHIPIMMIAAVAAIVLIGHLVTLVTGRPFEGRFSP